MPKICDREIGCMLGLSLGDALCAPWEGGPAERVLWCLIGRTREGKRRWTDDTRMALDIAASLVERGEVDPDHLARTFAGSYRWSRGYGPGAAKVLKRIRWGLPWEQASRSVHAEGSFGNGAAMRVAPLALFYRHRRELLPGAVEKASAITHAHPLALEGARIIASAVLAALDGLEGDALLEAASAPAVSAGFRERISALEGLRRGDALPGPGEVASLLGHGISALESCVTALYLGERFAGEPFGELIRFVRGVGGDADTIGAMAGAIWGARNGAEAIPKEEVASVEETGAITELTRRLCEGAPGAKG